jgi:hypothetical protein
LLVTFAPPALTVLTQYLGAAARRAARAGGFAMTDTRYDLAVIGAGPAAMSPPSAPPSLG